MPPGAKGRHLSRRFRASQQPNRTPWISIASRAYCEQVGWNLQPDTSSGDNPVLYAHSSARAMRWGTEGARPVVPVTSGDATDRFWQHSGNLVLHLGGAGRC